MYWQYDILNAVAVVQHSPNADTTVITYDPYREMFIQIPSNAYDRKELFIEKDLNIFGHPMNIVMYKDTLTLFRRRHGTKSLDINYDSLLPTVISSAMNATLFIKTPLTKDLNIEDIRNADLSINSFLNVIHEEVGIEETILLRRDDICLLVPYDQYEYVYNNIAQIATPLVWIMMAVVILQASIILYLIRIYQRHQPWKHIFLFDIFRFHMNQAVSQMPKQVSPRWIMASWLMYCVIMNSIFQGSFYKSLSDDNDAEIATIDELLKNNQEIVVSNILYNTTQNFLNNSPLKNHFKVINFLEYLNLVESNTDDYSFVARARGAKYFANIQIHNGAPVYYTMNQCVVPFMTYYFVRRGCPYLKRINYLLRLADESGLFSYWEEQLSQAYNKVKQHQHFNHALEAEHIEHFIVIFEIWGFGLAISVAVFLLEVSISSIKLHANRWFKPKKCHAQRVQII